MTEPQIKPTAEQEKILSFISERNENLMIVARAGGAKTTTLRLIAEVLPSKTIRTLAFNKKIAEEMQKKMPLNVKSTTLNSAGHGAVSRLLGGKRIILDDNKLMRLFKEITKALPIQESEELWDDYSDVIDCCKHAKNVGYLPINIHPAAKPLMNDPLSFFDSFDIELSQLQQWCVSEIIVRSFREAISGTIDYSDQLYIPVLMPVSFDPYDVTMIDEAQDLSPINHAMLKKMLGRGRLIAVGDPCQAIYGFRGADEESMEKLKVMFKMEVLNLTVCFRSAKSIVTNARWRAPDMAYVDSAPEGIVSHLDKWDFNILQPRDAIICRNNAPLFSLALSMLREGLYPEILGGQTMKNLLAIMKKLGPQNMPVDEAMQALEKWRETKAKKYKSSSRADDIFDCLSVFFDEASTLGEAMNKLSLVLEQSGQIFLMTGHKSKGLEFDRVFFLDRFLLRKEGQDLNIRYVIETRAKRELYYVKSDQRV